MEKTFINLIVLLTFGALTSFAQNIGINGTGANAHPSALLDLDASPTNNTGFAMPSLTTAQRLAIASPKNGLLVFDTNLGGYYRFSTINNKWDCATTPAGTFNYFCNVTAPIGYLVCDGSLQSTTTYPELFNAIGYLYGGSGATFQLPDLRGEFVRGAALTGTVDAGRTIGSWQVDDFRSHSHQLPSEGGSGGSPQAEVTVSSYNGVDVGLNNTYPSGGTETRPRNIALLSCIKY